MQPGPQTPRKKDEENESTPRPHRKRILRFLPLALLIGGGILFWFLFDLGAFFTLETLQTERSRLDLWLARNWELALLLYMVAYVTAVAFSLPVGSFMTVLGGFLFGILVGGTLALVSASLGSLLVFLAARTAFRDLFHAHARSLLSRIRHHFEDQAFSYMLFLRLVPLFPFWLVNIAPAFTRIRPITFFLATLLGSLPATFVFASFGSGLGAVLDSGEPVSLALLLEPHLLLPLIGLGILVLVPVIYRQRKRIGRSLKKLTRRS